MQTNIFLLFSHCAINKFMGASHLKILMLGQTPPPYHGQAVATEILRVTDWRPHDVSFIRMNYSKMHEEVGKFSFHKIFLLFRLVWKVLRCKYAYQEAYLYYPPSGPAKIPLIRDIIFLNLVKWYFKGIILHYHAGGLPQYLEKKDILSKLAKNVYSGASLSIEIADLKPRASDYFSANKMTVVPNGIYVPCQNVNSLGLKSEKINILFVGSLSEGKGVFEILETIKRCRELGQEVERFSFRIAGAWSDSNEKKIAEQRVEEYAISNLVTWVGEIRGEKKWEEYANADVFFFPTHYENENFPLVLIEALACSLPIISTNWRGIPQLISDSEAAILCEIKDVEQFANQIIALAKNPGKRKIMAHNARKHYERNYTEKKFIEGMKNSFNLLK